MTLYRGNPTTALAAPAGDGPISLGVEFQVTDIGCTLNGFRFYQGGAPWSGAVTAALYAVGGTAQLTTPVTVSTLNPWTASSEKAGSQYGAGMAFDGNAATQWLAVPPTPAAPQWLRQDTTVAKVATGYTITQHQSSNIYSPTSWKFQGSNDGTTWADLDTRSAVAWGAAGTAQTFTFSNSTAYVSYRILATANNGSPDYLSIAELVIAGVVFDPSSYWREATLATPYALTMGTKYRAVLLFGGASRPASPGSFGTTLTSGPLTEPSNATATNGQHTYTYGSSMTNPTSSAGANYMLDVIVEQSSIPSYSSEVLADSPLAYWRLGDTGGSTSAADSSGNGRSMNLSGGVTFGTPGLVSDSDTAATFNGSTGYARSSAYAAWMSPTALTVEAIIKTSSTATMSVIDRDASSSNPRAFQFRINAGKLEFITIDGGAGVVTATSPGVVNDGAAHHVAATYDASNIRLYVDGVLVTTKAAAGALSTEPAQLAIGANFSGASPAAFFNGIIDEAAYYGTALSGARVAAHVAAMTTSGAPTQSGAASMTATSTLTTAATATPTQQAVVTMASTSTLAALATQQSSASASLVSSSTLAASATGTVAAASSYSSEVLADSPAVFLQLDETSGTTLADSSGNARPFTINTATGLTLGVAGAASIPGTAIACTGSHYISRTSPTFLDGITSLTVEAWVKFTSTSTMGILGREDVNGGPGNGTRQFQFRVNAGKLEFIILNAAGSVTSAASPLAINDGSWHHVVGRWGGGAISVCVDGAQVATATSSGTLGSNGTSPLTLASLWGSVAQNMLTGSIDAAAIYPGVSLSDARVAAHHTAGVATGPATQQGVASLVATSTLTADATTVSTPTQSGAASMASTSTLTVSATQQSSASASLVSSSTLSDSATVVRAAGAALSSSSTLTATAGGFVSGSASLTASSTLTDTAVVTRVAAVSLSASLSLIAAADIVATTLAACALTATSVLTANGSGMKLPTVIQIGRRTGVAQFHALSGSFWLPVLIGESGSQPVDFSVVTSDPPSEPRGEWLTFAASASEMVTVTSTAAFPLTVETWSGDAHDIAELTQLATGASTVTAPLALGQQALVRAYPTTATDVGTATVSWSVAPRPDSGLLSFTAAAEILETPGWLAVGIACASPGATLEFTLDGAATVVFTTLVDDLGLVAADSVLLPQLTAGTHTIVVADPVTGQSASQDFVVDLVPDAPLAPGADVGPSVDPTSVRWVLQDPAPGGESFVFPINPSEMSSPHFPRNVTPEHTLAPSGHSVIWEGLPDPVSWQVKGSVETQAHVEALERFYALRRRFFVVDHLRRAWVVSFESLEFTKKRSTNDWANDYTLKFLILAGPVATS